MGGRTCTNAGSQTWKDDKHTAEQPISRRETDERTKCSISNKFAMLVNARIVAMRGTSNKLPSGLSVQTLDDREAEDKEVNPGVFPLLLEARDDVGRPKAESNEYS
jgi:hypothetical protein